jgi:hypothetical protein
LLATASAFAIASPAAASTVVTLGTIGPGVEVFDSFNSGSGSFVDDYLFTISSSATVKGSTSSFGIGFANVSITEVSLLRGGSFLEGDLSPGDFTFSNLSAGNYMLAVSGNYSGGPFGIGGGGYLGTISATPVSATPLPPSWTMMLAGLLVAGVFAFRRRDKVAVSPA